MPRLLAALTALSLSAALAPALAGAADAGPPTDYTELAPLLSQPVFAPAEIQREVVRLRSKHDNVELYMEVTRPKGDGPFPVVLEASPYHGTVADREGTRILGYPKVDGKSVGLTGWFAPRGYAVVMFDLRGTGRSRGCLDQLGPNDAKDLKQVVKWAASQPWSNGRVGMTGHSYVGSTPNVAAAMNAKGLATIVPSAGLASMYDHQFQGGVPFYLQWAGPQWAYQYLAVMRKAPAIGKDPVQNSNTGDDFGNNPQDTGCGLPQSALVSGEDQLSGRYADWHAERDWSAGAAGANIPVFLVHGVNDNAARITAADWFLDRGGRPDDKAWIGQWDHASPMPSTTDKVTAPTYRQMQFTYALTAWFDRHLKRRDVPTGPPVEMFLADGTFSEARRGARQWTATDTSWPPSSTPTVLGTGDGTLGGAPAAAARSFTGSPTGSSTEGSPGVSFVSAAFTESVVFAGMPRLRLSAAVTAPRVNLIATLYEETSGGVRRRITQCTLNPELRDGLGTTSPVVPGIRYDLQPPCMAMAHRVLAGRKLVLRITTADPDKVSTFAFDPNITVFAGPGATTLTLPQASPGIYADSVPLQ